MPPNHLDKLDVQLPELFAPEDLVPVPFPSVQWLKKRLNAGEITGSKIGHKWWLTAEDVAAAVRKYSNANQSKVTTTPARRRAS